MAGTAGFGMAVVDPSKLRAPNAFAPTQTQPQAQAQPQTQFQPLPVMGATSAPRSQAQTQPPQAQTVAQPQQSPAAQFNTTQGWHNFGGMSPLQFNYAGSYNFYNPFAEY